MSTEANKFNAITQQNKLLQEQNVLLREQNELLRNSAQSLSVSDSKRKDDRYEILVEDIDRDEMRSGFLVTSQRKKLWNVQINLIKLFAEICERHNLRWYAIGGTLLGAVRHKGYIPWDDDVDIIMFRPDYEKFKRIAIKEIQEPYFLDLWYNFQMECDKVSRLTDASLPMITDNERRNQKFFFPFSSYLKIRDSRTFQLIYPKRKHVNQGICIDIFPLDPLPYNVTKDQAKILELARVLFIATSFPEVMKNAMEQKQKFILSYKSLTEFLSMPYKLRGVNFDKFMLDNFFKTERMGDFWRYSRSTISNMKMDYYYSKDFRDVVKLPFEKIEVFAPVDYENILTTFYGDNWRTPMITHIHSREYSIDVSYKEYFAKSALVK